MSIHASIYGRAVADPKRHITKGGKPMSTIRLAVDATAGNVEERQTLWLDVLAFGANAELLAGVHKGEMVSATGKVTKSVYTPQGGTEREQLTLIADGLFHGHQPTNDGR